MMILRLLILAASLGAASAFAQPGPIPPGNASQVADVAGTPLTVFTYRPACAPRLLLLVFHGVDRNAGPYRDHARPLADKLCAIIVAPEFDQRRFPRDLYQYGGITTQPPGHRTVDLVPPLSAWAQAASGVPGLKFVLLGHSAGAQFLDRLAAFVPTGAAAIIVANPSTWVLPSTTVPVPFGFGGDPAGDAAVRAYLGRPVSVLLGTADTGSRNLASSAEAMAQGPNRHERGLNAVQMARTVAGGKGWPLGWTSAEVPGVGHNAAAMFGSEQALEAVRRALQ